MRIRLLTLLPLAALAASAQQTTVADIYYTGRLLGHARIPAQQETATRVCDPPHACKASDEADILLKLLKDSGYTHGANQLLLGLGDNFGPNYGARTMLDSAPIRYRNTKGQETSGQANPILKDFLVWWLGQWMDIRLKSNAAGVAAYGKVEVKGQTDIPFDNVAEYLSQAGYQALVPGKHDFYFGPERLRQLDQLLRKRNTALLGANMQIQTIRVKPASSIPEPFKTLPYEKSQPALSFSLPKAVYPWAVSFKVSGLVSVKEQGVEMPAADLALWKAKSVTGSQMVLARTGLNDLNVAWSLRPYKAQLCDAQDDRPEDIQFASCTDAPAPNLTPQAGAAVPARATFKFGRALQANHNYALCLVPTTAGSNDKPVCSSFSVVQPFWTWGRTGGAPPPYYVTDDKRIAVFGVMDPGLQASLPTGNAGWINKNPDFETMMNLTDPKEAFDQAWDACVAAGDCTAAMERVLLAQMPEEHAGALARQIGGKFLAVIAEANTRQATPGQTINRSVDEKRAIVISPGPINPPNDSDNLQLLVHRFTVKEDTAKQTREFAHAVFTKPYPYAPFAGKVDPNRVALGPVGKGPRTLEQMSLELLVKAGVPEADVKKLAKTTRVERAVLEQMRRSMGADIAILQARDLFRLADTADQPIASGVGVEEVLNRVLWKGDFLLKITVTGAVLDSVMTRSKGLADLDKDPNKVETETGRNLIQAGIAQDPVSKTWYINGGALEKARVYSLALPDYLAFGDAAYPQLKTGDGLERIRIRNLKELGLLANAVCLGLAGDENCTQNQVGLVDMTPENLLDNIQISAPDVGAGYSFTSRLIADLGSALVPASPLANAVATEKHVRHTFSLALEKLEGGFSKYSHDAKSERDRGDTFAGLSAPEIVNNPESAAITSAGRLRARITGEHGDVYLLGEETLNQVQQRNDKDVYVTSLKSNLWSWEGGYYWRAFKSAPARPEWVVLSALRYERSIFDPATQIKFGDGTLTGSLRKPSFLSGRLGLRWDKGDNTNWLEAGYQGGKRYGLLSTLVFTGPPDVNGSTTFTCSAINVGKNSLGNCVKTNSNPTVPDLNHPPDGKIAVPDDSKKWTFKDTEYVNRLRWGPFLRYHVDWPLLGYKQISFVSDANLEFYHRLSDDIETDTRMYVDWSAALKLKLWDNLGIGPKYQRTYFKNKVQGQSITGQTFSFGVEYRFEWRPGIPFGRALRVPYPPK